MISCLIYRLIFCIKLLDQFHFTPVVTLFRQVKCGLEVYGNVAVFTQS